MTGRERKRLMRYINAPAGDAERKARAARMAGAIGELGTNQAGIGYGHSPLTLKSSARKAIAAVIRGKARR